MNCIIPESCVVVLIGPAGSGKSTFARKHFKPTEILCADDFRAMVCDDAKDQTTSHDAFEVLYALAEQRLRRGRLTVFDATNVQPFALEQIARLARKHYMRMVGFGFNLPLADVLKNNASRERQVPEDIIRRHMQQYRRTASNLQKYKLRSFWTFKSNEEADAAEVTRARSRHYAHFDERGPFDIIGDIHGCADELEALLAKLGYVNDGFIHHPDGRKVIFVGDYVDRGPESWRVLKLVRAMEAAGTAYCLPGNHEARLARKLRKASPAELLRLPERLAHGLDRTLTNLIGLSAAEVQELIAWMEGLHSHLILDEGRLVVSHAGLREEMFGRTHGDVYQFCLYGNPTGEKTEDGFPVREDWVKDYHGKALVVYGHIHAGVAEFRNNTVCVDTNVYMGGSLTALRYPEREIVSVPAAKVYFESSMSKPELPVPIGTTIRIDVELPTGRWTSSIRTKSPSDDIPAKSTNVDFPPRYDEVFTEGVAWLNKLADDTPAGAERLATLGTPAFPQQAGDRVSQTIPAVDTNRPLPRGMGYAAIARAEALLAPDLIDIADLIDKRQVDTRLFGPVRFHRDEAAAALEQMGRFAVDPRWLIYLPPTMSPCDTAPEGSLLEQPDEAFGYYKAHGVSYVVCEEKHMGSRLIAVVCKDEAAAAKRFGVRSGAGICYTRLGRRFFTDEAIERTVLEQIRTAVTKADLWTMLSTDWLCLDCELMPWSAKASGLLRRQYAATGVAGRTALQAEAHTLVDAVHRPELNTEAMRELAGQALARGELLTQYVEAYRRYCWPTDGATGLKLAPFHIMAAEGQVFAGKSHLWHMEIAQKLAEDSTLLVPTPFKFVALESETAPVACIATGETPAAARNWWFKMTTKWTEQGEVADVEGMVVKPLQFCQSTPDGLVQPALKVRGREYLRIIYGPEYTMQLDKLRKRSLGRKRRLAAQEFALGIEGLERFVQHKPLAKVHECAFAVMALECEPLDPRL